MKYERSEGGIQDGLEGECDLTYPKIWSDNKGASLIVFSSFSI